VSEIVFGWPEWVWVGVTVFNLIGTAVLDGEPKRSKHSLALMMLSTAIGAALLYFGGFFTGPNP